MKNRPLFTEQLAHAWSHQDSMLCVGLDPDPKQFPASKIPVETIKINFPVMTNAKDTLGILWYLKPENYSAKGEVNVIIIGIAADN